MVVSLHFGCGKETRSHSFKSRLNYILEDICSIAKKRGWTTMTSRGSDRSFTHFLFLLHNSSTCTKFSCIDLFEGCQTNIRQKCKFIERLKSLNADLFVTLLGPCIHQLNVCTIWRGNQSEKRLPKVVQKKQNV